MTQLEQQEEYNIIIAISLSKRTVGNIAPSANDTVKDAFNALNRTVQQYDRQYYYYVGVLLGERERASFRNLLLCLLITSCSRRSTAITFKCVQYYNTTCAYEILLLFIIMINSTRHSHVYCTVQYYYYYYYIGA